MQTEIAAALPVTITMPARDWLIIRQVLAKAPYDIAAPIIGALTAQLEAAAAMVPANGATERSALDA